MEIPGVVSLYNHKGTKVSVPSSIVLGCPRLARDITASDNGFKHMQNRRVLIGCLALKEASFSQSRLIFRCCFDCLVLSQFEKSYTHRRVKPTNVTI
ncbi:hypothetical protein V1478_003248 [Vespula squamosa]|uniref:Uncharacterized protein n=1 Tax=Vespula squamosa TaxID=30214 RepID=A0ABD2BS53_VESSQ